MPDRAAYDRSSFDRARLDRYAARVARETRMPANVPLRYQVDEIKTVRRTRSSRTWYGGTKLSEVESRQKSTREVEVIGAHWTLSYRRWHKDETTKHGDGSSTTEETHYNHYYVLLPSGELKHVWTRHETTYNFGGRFSQGLLSDEYGHEVRPLSDDEIFAFDFECRQQTWQERRGTTQIKGWSDVPPGRKLLKHSKGVGINLALKAVLNQT